MKVTPAVLASLALLLAAACDLAELQEAHRDATPDGAGPANPDASGATDSATPDGPDDDGMIPPGAPLGSCDPARWVASASQSHPINPASYAIDGLPPSRWTAGEPERAGQYFQVDFGGFVMLRQVALEHGYLNDGTMDWPRGVDVLVSYDGADFSRRLASSSNLSDPGPVLTVDFAPHAALALRVALTDGGGTGSWWTMHELRLGCEVPAGTTDAGVDAMPEPDAGTPGGTVNPNHDQWTATASESSTADPPGRAIDGVATTRWASGKSPQYGDEWFQLDLGRELTIHRVVLDSAGATADYPSAFALELSTDGNVYTPVARGLGSAQTEIPFAPTAARYVRIKQIGSGYDHWWGIDELSVVGE